MIDLDSETPLSLVEAAKSLPGRPHISTLHRWRQRGVRSVRLETFMAGGRRFTTREALNRFMDRITAADDGSESPPLTCKQRERAFLAAERELCEAGF